MTSRIHPSAVVHPGARLAADVEIGPYTVLGADVEIGDERRFLVDGDDAVAPRVAG